MLYITPFWKEGFLGLTLICFWLTAFPLQGFLLPNPKWFQIFLIFHFLGYITIFLKYDFLERYKFFPLLMIPFSLLNLSFPFFIEPMQFFLFLIFSLFSPLILIRIFLFIPKGALSPYLGIILGNLLALILQVLPVSNYVKFTLLGLSLLSYSIFQLKRDFPSREVSPQVDLSLMEKVYLLIAFYLFYLSGSIIYKLLENGVSISLTFLIRNLFFYCLGILFGLYLLRKKTWKLQVFFMLAPFLLSLSNIFFHFEQREIYSLGSYFLFISFGLMDLLLLFYYLNYYHNLKELSLALGLVSLSIFTSQGLFKIIPFSKDNLLIFLSFTSLFAFLFFYKINFREKTIPIESGDKEKSDFTVEDLLILLNQRIAPHSKKITHREAEVLYYLVYKGFKSQEIADFLGLSRSTVREYIRRAAFKLDLHPTLLVDKIKGWIEKNGL